MPNALNNFLLQGSGHESSMFFPIHSRRTMHPDSAETAYSGYSDFNTSIAPVMQKKKLNEEDFMVPVFVQPELGHDHSKNSNGMDREKFSPSGLSYLACSVQVQNTSSGEPKQTSIMGSNLRQEGRSQNKEYVKELMAVDQQPVKSVKSSSASKKTQGPSKQFNASVDLERSGQLASTGASLDHESGGRSQLHNSMCGNDVSYEPVRSIKNGHAFIPTRDSCQAKLGSLDNPTFDSEYHEAMTHGSMQIGSGDGGDNASETSMVDSISEFDISPEDVVGMIGQKHFWKARRAIVK